MSSSQPLQIKKKSTLVDIQAGPWDIYAGNTAAKFGLSNANQNAALQFWGNFKARPSGVEYISIAGTGLSTENTYYFKDTNYQFGTSTDGDGTVPHWSATHGAVDKLYTLPGEHIDIMNTGAFERLIRDIFASSRPVRRPIMDHPVVSISVGKKDTGRNELMEVLLVPDSRTTNMTGRLVFDEISIGADDQNVTFIPTGLDVPIAYQGPPISSLKVEVPAPQAVGAFRIGFEGTHRTVDDTTAVIFVGPFSENQIVKSVGKSRRKKAAKKGVAKKSKK